MCKCTFLTVGPGNEASVNMDTKGPRLEQVYFSLSHPHSLVMLTCKHACNVVHSNYKVHVNNKIKRQVSWIARQTGEKIPFSRNQHLFVKSMTELCYANH